MSPTFVTKSLKRKKNCGKFRFCYVFFSSLSFPFEKANGTEKQNSKKNLLLFFLETDFGNYEMKFIVVSPSSNCSSTSLWLAKIRFNFV